MIAIRTAASAQSGRRFSDKIVLESQAVFRLIFAPPAHVGGV
jgi:hypothetical protein